MLELRKAGEADCPRIHQIQVKAFAPLLAVYQDHHTSPAAERMEQVLRRMRQSFTDYYLICLDDREIGFLRVCDFGEACRLSPIAILPEYQGRGYAQSAMVLAEKLYPGAKHWSLDTIAQEPKLCHLYEKMGYRRTGKTDRIKDGMDLVFYQKEVDHNAGTGNGR